LGNHTIVWQLSETIPAQVVAYTVNIADVRAESQVLDFTYQVTVSDAGS